jgi:hypothetical protein
MKWNEGESLAFLASRTPDWQGRLSYKPPKQGKLPGFMPNKGLFTYFFRLCSPQRLYTHVCAMSIACVYYFHMCRKLDRRLSQLLPVYRIRVPSLLEMDSHREQK